MKKLFTLFIGLGALQASAQMDSCNVFLQGNYVEVGISPTGSFGTSIAAPTSYHPHGGLSGSSYHPCSSSTSGQHLGFVADPAMDGWSVGTPAYMGDYFLPGSPFEGWEIQIDTNCSQQFNLTAGGFTGACSGSNISYSATGGIVSSTWQGNMDSLQITQVTSLDTSALYFKMSVTLTNLSVLGVDNIYYFRSLDPDNDQSWAGGSFSTVNKIVHQGPDTTVVSATGTTGSMSMLSLGSLDTNSRCLIYSTWPLASSVNLSSLYNGTFAGTYTTGATYTGDVAIGLVYHIGHLATVDSASDSVYRTTTTYTRHPANSVTFNFFYAFGQVGLDSALSAFGRTTSSGSLKVNNVNAAADVKVYPNPTSGLLNIAGLVAGDEIALVDMMGNQLSLQGTVSGTGNDKFSTSSVPVGNYILMIKDANGTVKSRVKVTKQ